MRLGTFNVQNMRLRQVDGQNRLDGAMDGDEPGCETLDPVQTALADRKLTAAVIHAANADLVALQEGFDQATLEHFHSAFLAPLGLDYPHRICLEGNDGRSMDVAVLSRKPLEDVRSHAGLRFSDIGLRAPEGHEACERIFRRDCLAVRCDGLWIFVCHFKAVGDTNDPGHHIRRAEADALRAIIEGAVPEPETSPWVALGDFNAHDRRDAADLAVLGPGFAVDLTMDLPADDRWTYFHRQTGACTCPDRIFVSSVLAAQTPRRNIRLIRRGMAREARPVDTERFADVGYQRPHASDHALLMADLARKTSNPDDN